MQIREEGMNNEGFSVFVAIQVQCSCKHKQGLSNVRAGSFPKKEKVA